MYWGALIAIDSFISPNSVPSVDLFVDKETWVLKIGTKNYPCRPKGKKNNHKKTLKSCKWIRLKKTSYATNIVEFRAQASSPWYLTAETRGKIKVIDDEKGIIKITEGHQIKIQQLKTGKTLIFQNPIKQRILMNQYLVLWSKPLEGSTAWVYKLPEMELLKIQENPKEKTQNIVPPQEEEL